MATTKERRRHARQSVIRPCKILRVAIPTFTSARTRDLSVGGALIEVESPRPLAVGEQISLGVSWSRAAVMSQAALTPAHVVRVESVGASMQVVAVKFDKVESAAAVA